MLRYRSGKVPSWGGRDSCRAVRFVVATERDPSSPVAGRARLLPSRLRQIEEPSRLKPFLFRRSQRSLAV